MRARKVRLSYAYAKPGTPATLQCGSQSGIAGLLTVSLLIRVLDKTVELAFFFFLRKWQEYYYCIKDRNKSCIQKEVETMEKGREENKTGRKTASPS